MKLAVSRCPESGEPLASQSAISRLENAPSKTEAARLPRLCSTVRHDGELAGSRCAAILDSNEEVVQLARGAAHALSVDEMHALGRSGRRRITTEAGFASRCSCIIIVNERDVDGFGLLAAVRSQHQPKRTALRSRYRQRALPWRKRLSNAIGPERRFRINGECLEAVHLGPKRRVPDQPGVRCRCAALRGDQTTS